MRALLPLLACLTQVMAADPARDARWRQDLDVIATQLPALHPNLFFQTPRGAFNQAVSDLRDAIPQLSDTEVMVGLARIVALPGDGHTSLYLTQAGASFHTLPLNMRWFEDGLYITAAGTDYPKAVGARVLRIGDRSVDEAYQAIASIVSHENDSWVRDFSPTYFIITDILQALKIAPDILTVRFELEDIAGTQFTLDIASHASGVSVKGIFVPDGAGFTPLWRQHLDQNYWFTYIESSRTLYFAYNQCAERADLPFAQFNAQLWAVFDSNPVERFVIDLRNNGGGDSNVLNPFLTSGAARGARFTKTRPILIIGRHTFSSAIINAVQMRQSPVRTMGEPSGGSTNHYGNVKTFVLPNSRLTVNYSTQYFSFPGYGPGPMLPDVTVPFYSADYFARHDPFVAAALADAVPQPPIPHSPIAVLNAAALRLDRPVAPGSLATIFGDLGGLPSADAGVVPWPLRLSGVEVIINDASAPLIAVRPGQINFQVPLQTNTGQAAIRVLYNDAEIAAGTAAIERSAPGIFVADSLDLTRPGAILDENDQLVTEASPAQKGSIIQIYATGQGGAGDQPSVYIGAELADLLFSGPQPLVPGLWQINVRMPDSVTLSGQVPVFVVIDSIASNAVTTRIVDSK
jgi:uncharacterized protein (TIGR03437 family)